jgi:hypothetical protein
MFFNSQKKHNFGHQLLENMKVKFKIICLLLLVFSVSQSCKKDCDFPKEDSLAGEIIKDAHVKGFNTSGIYSVHYADEVKYPILVSFDKGYTYIPVDFSKYTVMNFPISTSCSTYFEKEVTIDPTKNKVTYTLGVHVCPDCEEVYRQDNWVLVNKFSENYNVIYQKK